MRPKNEQQQVQVPIRGCLAAGTITGKGSGKYNGNGSGKCKCNGNGNGNGKIRKSVLSFEF
jgi:hypothetical protein